MIGDNDYTVHVIRPAFGDDDVAQNGQKNRRPIQLIWSDTLKEVSVWYEYKSI